MIKLFVLMIYIFCTFSFQITEKCNHDVEVVCIDDINKSTFLSIKFTFCAKKQLKRKGRRR